MKVSIAIALVAVCVCLVEARHIRTKREISKNLLSELDRELKTFLNRRDDGDGTDPTPPTGGKTHGCEEKSEEVQNKVKNRGEEIIDAVIEMFKDVYFTAAMFSATGEIDIQTASGHIASFLEALGIVAQTPKGEQYAVQLVQDSKNIAMISIDDPKKANRIIQIVVDEVKGYFEDNFPETKPTKPAPPPTDDPVTTKRGQDSMSEEQKKEFLKEVMKHFCALNRQDVVTDIDRVIDDGLEVVRGASSLLRSIRAIVATERATSWGEMIYHGLSELSKLTKEGDQAKLDAAFEHASKIRERVEQAIDEAYPSPPAPAPADNSKRVLQGISNDATSWGEMIYHGLSELSKLTKEGDQAKLDAAFDHASKIRERVEQAINEAYPSPPAPAPADNSKRVLQGISNDDLRQFLNTALRLYQTKRK